VSRRRFHLVHLTRLVAISSLTAALALVPARSSAQGAEEHRDHGGHPRPQPAQDPHAGHATHEPGPDGPAGEDLTALVDLDRARNASGTAWQPEESPHAAFHHTAAGWQLMFHTLLFAGYDYQASDRGAHAPVGIGWVMGMATRRFRTGALTARVMLSPEPWTAQADGGYPLLLQSGETYQGVALHDRQHPHDLFMEIGLLYTQGLGDDLALQLYLAPAGEPALGPVAFPHRQSAASDPLAALVHHWQDSTHISFGVITAGIITRWGKLEGSWFNGREPDEERTDFDLRRPDSFSLRASVAPAPGWSGQVSYGYLPDHDVLHPGEPLHKATTSVMYHRARAGTGHWASTAALGLNKHGHGHAAAAALLETNLDLDGTHVLFGRLELVQKSGEDLALPSASLHHETFWLPSLAAGYLYNLPPFAGLVAGLGLRAAAGLVPAEVRPYYGTRAVLGGIAFLRLAVAPPAPGAPAHEHGQPGAGRPGPTPGIRIGSLRR
jgi:hypothetical protein